jgi:hypothetical protein
MASDEHQAHKHKQKKTMTRTPRITHHRAGAAQPPFGTRKRSGPYSGISHRFHSSSNCGIGLAPGSDGQLCDMLFVGVCSAGW